MILLFKIAIVSVLLGTAFDGPIRYYSSLYGVPWIVYSPKLFAILVLSLAGIEAVTQARIKKTGLLLMTLLTTGVLTAYVNIDNYFQILFGIYLFVPLALGVTFGPRFHSQWHKHVAIVQIVFWCTFAGVCLDLIVDFPWSGYFYFYQDIELSATRRWWSFGFERLAGFTRSSVSAASILIVFGTYLIFYYIKSKKRFFIIAITGVGILLTTSKGLLSAFFISILYIFLFRKLPRYIWMLWITSILSVLLILPLLHLYTDSTFHPSLSNYHDYFYSLKARIFYTWPNIIDYIQSEGSLIFGVGVGGIGISQSIYSGSEVSSTDNLFFQLYSQFGIFGVAVLFFLWFSAGKLRYWSNHFDAMIATWLIIILTYGITNNITQGACLGFCFGIVFSYLMTLGKSKSYHSL